MGKAVYYREKADSGPSPALQGLLVPFGEVRPGTEP